MVAAVAAGHAAGGRAVDGSSAGCVLEVGCGTGNYAAALAGATGVHVIGVDPSLGMLAHAAAAGARVCAGRAEALPLRDATCAFVFTVDVVHHMADVAAYCREAARILQPGGLLCTTTDSERIIATRQPLATYWPETVAIEQQRYHPLERLRAWMEAAGLAITHEETVEHAYLLSDARPYRERAFSVLRLLPEAAWQRGLARLEADLAQGPLPCISRYTLLWARQAHGLRNQAG